MDFLRSAENTLLIYVLYGSLPDRGCVLLYKDPKKIIKAHLEESVATA